MSIPSTEDEADKSNAGGAATNAGIEFQERVAAWCLVIMHCGSDPRALMDLPDVGRISAIRFEAETPIDDLVLVTEEAGSIFFQVKRRVSLSAALGSNFVGTLTQFVREYVTRGGRGNYVLAVAPDASNTVRTTLRKLLDLLRLDPDAWTAVPLSRADARCIATYSSVVGGLFKAHPHAVYDSATLIEFSRRVFIREFAVNTGQGHETAALTLLGKNARVPPELVWTYLIGQSLRFAARRASVKLEDLRELIGPYFNPVATPTPELAMNLIMKSTGPLPAGREVIAVEGFPKEKDIAVMEFYRFDADGRRRLRFKGNAAFWNDKIVPNGSKLLHRCATSDGMVRYIEAYKSSFEGKDVCVFGANDIEAEVNSPFARAHAALLERMVRENPRILKCLHCGKPLSQAWMTLVEIDDDDSEPAVGAVHDPCLRPIDRVIGQLNCPVFEGRDYLKKFDVDRWVELRLHGQRAFNSRLGALTGKVAYIAWNPDNEAYRENSYCIEISLSDGTTRHVESRGALDRYDFEGATKRAAFMTRVHHDAAGRHDPVCYTSVNYAYGFESLLLRLKEPEETLLECGEARVVPYKVELGRRYQRRLAYYSPLCRLVHADSEKPIVFREWQLVLTDPLRLPDFIKIWQNAGFILPEYEIRILETGDQVDRWFSQLFSNGEQPAIDPICDRNGNLIRGFLVADIRGVASPWD